MNWSGAEVTLYLPRAEEAVTGATDVAAEFGPTEGQGERIMVIEDDADVREVMVTGLERLGYEVIDGGDGANALKIAEDRDLAIDLLLTDVVLPHGNSGPDLAAALAKQWRQMKVLMMTGYAESHILRPTNQDLKPPLIQKPFRMADLSRQNRDLLAGGER
jgi:DNA-binding NtrC family response regulator